MSNVHDLFSKKDDDENGSPDEHEDHSNDRFVGGIGDRGGGSGLAVQPNPDLEGGGGGNDRDAVFGLASNATGEESQQVRRTITMYRDGFIVDDGPYRRLDDDANAEFLRYLAQGRAPPELTADGQENVVVGLVDKRNQDYVETFQSFSGAGNTLGGGGGGDASNHGRMVEEGVFDPATLPAPTSWEDSGAATTSIAVRLPNGQRQVVKIAVTATVRELAAQFHRSSSSSGDAAAAGTRFRLVAGFPPQPLTDENATVEAAGLKGAQVQMQKVE